MVYNKTEREERHYLETIKKRLQDTIELIDKKVAGYAQELKEQKDYLWENKAGMDHAEKVSVRQSVTQSALTGEAAMEKKKRLQKLIQSPWFGRFDFQQKNTDRSLPLYISVHAWYDEQHKANLIYDWRAPVSAMYYDFEPGPAHYDAPTGKVEGEITLKRQFRIRQGKMEYMLESSLNIHDEILQQELSKASDEKMKHIVATIQRDQNAIIRNEASHVLIIQGMAGSGKTSIALHRIAFLLYRYRETISSKDILIISPNKVFADYISNVLPELGEEKIPEKGMEEVAHEILDGKFRFGTFFDQVSSILEKNDENFIERVRFKATFEFVNKLNEYITFVENNYFAPVTFLVKRYPIPASYIAEQYSSLHRLPLFARFNEIAGNIERDLQYYNQYHINAGERNELRKSIKSMFRITNLRDLYRDFFSWLGEPGLFKYLKAGVFEYSDVFPLLYLKIRLEGSKPYDKVKHLLIDEMQDYTPVQYSVLARLFPCRKTILGDVNQSVNPFSSSDPDSISRVFPGSVCMELCKSYRSTYEIAKFAQAVQPASGLEVIERHGEAPRVISYKNRDSQIGDIKKTLAGFPNSGYNSMGIICKTQKQAVKMFGYLKDDFPQTSLLTPESAAYANGIIITSVHMAKGLEFDHVIIPDSDKLNYHTTTDRSLLYIACTRAMHRLEVFYTGNCTEFI